jgi:hypothetical protein
MTVHPYLRFRLRLTRHALAELAARLRSSAEIVVVLLGPTLLGLLAFAAMPAMLAASTPWPLALPLLLAHGVVMSLPVALLRPQVAPARIAAWLHALPVPPRLELQAALAVAGFLVAPLALAYAASLAIWLFQAPGWLLPMRSVAGTVSSLLLTWACAGWLLLGAVRQPAAGRAAPDVASSASPYLAQPRGGRLFLWRQLFWLPLFRNGSLAGPRLAALLTASLLAILLWMLGPSWLPRVAGALLASVLLVLLIHEADTFLRAQCARLRAIASSWPLSMGALGWHARTMLLAGSLLPLAVLAAAGLAAHAWDHRAGRVYLALACVTPPLLVLTPPFTARGRMALAAFVLMMMCATGSTIWN